MVGYAKRGPISSAIAGVLVSLSTAAALIYNFANIPSEWANLWGFSLAAWMIACSVILIPLAIHLSSSKDIFAPPVLILGIAAFDVVVRGGWLLLDPDGFRFTGVISDYDIGRALMLAFCYNAVAYIVFIACYWTAPASLLKWKPRMPLRTRTQWIIAVATIMLVVGYSTYLMFLAGEGGLSRLLLAMDERTELLRGRHYELAIIRWVYVAPILLFAVVSGLHKKRKIGIFAVVGLLLVGSAIVASFGGRGRALSPLIALAIIWHYKIRPIRLVTASMIGMLLIIGANVILVARIAARQSASLDEVAEFARANLDLASVSGQAEFFFTERIPFSHIDEMCVLISNMPRDVGWQISLPVAAAAVVVPRAVWADKPTGNAGTIFSAVWLPANVSSKSPGPVGTAFMIGSLPGIVVFFALNGLLWRALYEWFRRRCAAPEVVVVYVSLLAFGRSLLIPPYENIFIHLVPLAALYMILVIVRAAAAPSSRPS